MPNLLPSLVRFACSTFAIVGLSASSLAREAVDWEIGPVIRSKNYSVGMPPHPVRLGKGWYFDFPYPDLRSGHVHYVTFNPGSLAGKSRIIIRYKVKADQNVRFVSREYPDRTATVSLFFQRSGDTWTAKGKFNHYRWYAPSTTIQAIEPGVHEMIVDLSDRNWVPVSGGARNFDVEAFNEALVHSSRIGLVFGTAGGRGHGVFATGPARFTLIDFRIL
ncbi:hypothetical protein [Sphingopyxis sp. NJF-3]